MAILESISLKARNTTESMRLNNLIKANDKMMDKPTCQIGYQYVERHLEEEDAEFAEFLREIIRLRKENIQYMQELELMQMAKICPQCGFENPNGSRFCLNCGGRLDEGVQMQPVGKFCSSCGVQNAPDAAFCENCGNPLKM